METDICLRIVDENNALLLGWIEGLKRHSLSVGGDATILAEDVKALVCALQFAARAFERMRPFVEASISMENSPYGRAVAAQQGQPKRLTLVGQERD